MRNSRLIALFLVAPLLLSLTVGLMTHDHAAEATLSGFECAVDHGHADNKTAGSDSALHAAGTPHHHQCLGCQISQHCSPNESPSEGFASLVAAKRTVPRAQQVPPASLPWMGRTLRGPPQRLSP